MMRMSKKPVATGTLIQSAWFMAALTFVGGYIDAYTFVMRGGVFANNQTGNVAQLGIRLAGGNWMGALDALLPMLATIAGAMLAEHLKVRNPAIAPYRWQRQILVIEGLALIACGFVPVSVPHAVVNLTLSFIAAFQLSAFRSFEGLVHNTTISTGNLRTLGQLIYQALFVDKDTAFRAKTVRYLLVFSSFILGALLGTVGSKLIDIKSIWLCLLPLAWTFWVHRRSVPEAK